MNDSDKKQFKELMDGVTEIYNPDKKLSVVAFQIYFSALESYTFEQVKSAVSAHVTDTAHGSFYPKVADIIRHIEGGDITTDQVISAARLAETPLGILARIHIGTWDLDKQKDLFVLKQKAQECLELFKGWKKRAALGEYTDHEISIMLKHGVDPGAPFYSGLSGPPDPAALRLRAQDISQTDRHKFLLEEPYRGDNEKNAVIHPSLTKLLEVDKC